MQKLFESYIDQNLPQIRSGTSIVAISGGVDSVVLAYLCKNAGLNIVFAHCNFQLRGEDSDADAQFVEALGLKLNVETFTQHFDTASYAKAHKCSIQVAARELRYQWFQDLSQQLSFDYILTAHHADDHLETFFINLSRGTGLEGLTGIPEINGNIIRPLLEFSRDDILAYAKAEKIGWRDDVSNASVKYLRNKLRHEVIPILKGINPQLLQNMKKTRSYLKASQAIIDTTIDTVARSVITEKEGDLYLDIKKIQALKQPRAYLYELLKDYGFTEWNDVANLLDATSGKFVVSEHWRLIKDRTSLILTLKERSCFKAVNIHRTDTSVVLPIGTLKMTSVNNIDAQGSKTIYIDADRIQFPLLIREKQVGDIFYPLGMSGKKTLSKFFKDEKLSLVEKERTLLLCSSDAIVWIVGKRADDRFKVNSDTTNILKLQLL